MNANLNFKIGDLVYSSIPDSPQMKIEDFKDGKAICVWFSAVKVLQRGAFAVNTLRYTDIEFNTDDSWVFGH